MWQVAEAKTVTPLQSSDDLPCGLGWLHGNDLLREHIEE
jgi:hypothetical protein